MYSYVPAQGVPLIYKISCNNLDGNDQEGASVFSQKRPQVERYEEGVKF